MSESDNKSALRLTHVVYALQAVSFFNLGITLIIGVIINYVKRNDIKDSWLASHYKWQIRSFWYCMLWFTLGGLSFKQGIGQIILIASSIWLIYRIIKGWLHLFDKKPLYVKSS
ncbi:MAG: hypothetical protein OEY52_01790 [Gammaproteobacteria bacterium]|nr:hypothetical protein [Gammaproteobacteria bacterium]